MSKIIDLTGQRFGRLVVVCRGEDLTPKSGGRKVRWYCKCDCGNDVLVTTQNLLKGVTKSCGCFARDYDRNTFTTDMTGWVMKEHGVEDSKVKVINLYKFDKNGAEWNCVCECGNHFVANGRYLRRGRIKSCGCSLNSNIVDMTGWVMKEHDVPDSRVTVIERGKTTINSNGRRNNYWKCKCDCGNEFESTGIHIRSGACKSCGCFQKEKAKERHTVHGGKYTRLYRVWAGMKGRCENKINPAYYNYGGRGIRVCDGWHNFAVFREWAINNGYDETAQHGECTLDRINNNKNYEPSNCRWITMREQANNKRTNRFVEFQNETKTIAEWSKIIGISENLIMQRLNRGWTSNAALLTPINKLKTKHNITNEVLIEYCGKTMNMSDWSRELDIPYYLIRSRIRELGWSAEKAFTTPVKKKGGYDV